MNGEGVSSGPPQKVPIRGEVGVSPSLIFTFARNSELLLLARYVSSGKNINTAIGFDFVTSR